VCPCGGGGCGVVERTGLATLFEVQLSSGIARWSAGRVFLGRERRVRRRGKKKVGKIVNKTIKGGKY